MIELEFEGEYVVGAYGTAYRAIEVFKTGEMQGTHNERLRIIKLLEEQLAAHTLPNGTVYIEFQVISDLIALIKGEQK